MLREWSVGTRVGTARPFRGTAITRVQWTWTSVMTRRGWNPDIDVSNIDIVIDRANGIYSQTGCGVREEERNRGWLQGLRHEPLSEDWGHGNWVGEDCRSKYVGIPGAWF